EHGGPQAIERLENGASRGGRRAADRRRGGGGEFGKRGDGAVRRAEHAGGALEGRDEGAQPRRPDPRDLGEREVGGYLVATPIWSVCHSVSNSSGTPAPVTAEIPTTGAPCDVRISGRGAWDVGSRSIFVSTTTLGFAASSGEYSAASRRSSS